MEYIKLYSVHCILYTTRGWSTEWSTMSTLNCTVNTVQSIQLEMGEQSGVLGVH